MNDDASVIGRINAYLKTSVTLKLFWIGFLILLLLIPAAMIRSLIHEREQRSRGAVEEISAKWGGAQVIGGPVLSVPIRYTRRDGEGKATGTYVQYAHFLPDALDIEGKITPEIRSRGIYRAVLYNTPFTLAGSFSHPALDDAPSDDKEVLWREAVLVFSVPDMRGIKDQVTLDWGASSTVFNPGIPSQDVFPAGLSVPVRLDGAKSYPFSIRVNLNGSGRVSFLPLGKTTRVRLSSPWPSPSFVGDFLPEKREVTSSGFEAAWTVLHFNRTYPQHWIGKSYEVAKPDFGVELFQSVDHYQKTTRSAKYAVLFIFLTFVVFFFSELYGKHPLHTIQYLLVGFALCLFYLLLLSLSEHMPFWLAYVIASGAVVGLVTGYTKGVFAHKLVTGAVFGVMAGLYAFLYSLLQMEDYALLFGTIGLTAILGALMYLTRKMNWYALERR